MQNYNKTEDTSHNVIKPDKRGTFGPKMLKKDIIFDKIGGKISKADLKNKPTL